MSTTNTVSENLYNAHMAAVAARKEVQRAAHICGTVGGVPYSVKAQRHADAVKAAQACEDAFQTALAAWVESRKA